MKEGNLTDGKNRDVLYNQPCCHGNQREMYIDLYINLVMLRFLLQYYIIYDIYADII